MERKCRKIRFNLQFDKFRVNRESYFIHLWALKNIFSLYLHTYVGNVALQKQAFTQFSLFSCQDQYDHSFKQAMKLEAVNPLSPEHIHVATVTRVKGQYVWLSLEGETVLSQMLFIPSCHVYEMRQSSLTLKWEALTCLDLIWNSFYLFISLNSPWLLWRL